MGEEIGHTFTVVAFDIKACRQALARMIIVDQLSFKFVEEEGFQYLMSIFCNPSSQFPEGSLWLGIVGIFIPMKRIS